ncbi:conserved domain protein [Bacteroides sp. CAG:1076]|jgi:hypothetical protein|nr:conserved domain protein [Bacteroides sp. CAG:1076]
MKTFYTKSTNLFMVLAMILGIAFTGCSDDSDTPSVTPEFPALTEITCNAGETKELSFEANADWTLTSNKGWCQFENDGIPATVTYGKAGEQNIQIIISPFQETGDVAEISLKIGEQSQVICKISCNEKVYADLVIKDEEGNIYDAEHPLVIKGSGLTDNAYDIVYTTITVESEQPVGFAEKPNWLKALTTEETPGVFQLTFDKTSGLSPIYSFNKAEDKIVIATEDMSKKVEIPVSYEGLKETVISYVETDLSFSKSHMTLDYNSTYFSIANAMTGEETTYSLPLTLTVDQVRNDEFGYIIGSVERKELYPNNYVYTYNFDATGMESWVKVNINGKKVSLDVDKLTGDTERGAIVLLFSKDFCEKYKGRYNEILLDSEGYFDSYTYQKNIMVSFTQEPEKKVTNLQIKGYVKNSSGELVPFTSVPDGAAMLSDPNTPYFPYEDKTTPNFWYVVLSDKSLMENGNKIYLEIVGEIPEGYMVGVMNNWAWTNTKTTTETIDGKTYIVISGAPTQDQINKQPIMTVGVANFDMMDFLIECGIQVWL